MKGYLLQFAVMRVVMKSTLLALSAVSMVLAASAQAHDRLAVDKVEGHLSVMVLGSGGPVATAKGRASAGYLIFTDGKPRILMDAGGGTYQRLAKSGVNVKDLDLVLLSHLHIDHTADLSSIIKTIYFHNVGAGVTRAQCGKFPNHRAAGRQVEASGDRECSGAHAGFHRAAAGARDTATDTAGAH